MSARAKDAGKGLFGFVSKNPTVIGLGILAVTLFIFRDRIANFVTGGVSGTAQAAGQFGADVQGAFGAGFETAADFFGGLFAPPAAAEEPTITAIVAPPIEEITSRITEPLPLVGALGEGLGGFFGAIADFFGNIFQPAVPTVPGEAGMEGLPIVPDVPVSPFIPVAPPIAEQVIAPFVGGGPSFEGGFIFETPIQNLSLSQIIDRFMVTASQAANIRAIAEGFTPEEQAFLSQGPVDVGGFVAGGPAAVSDPAFIGLTPQEIIDRILGGPITRF